MSPSHKPVADHGNVQFSDLFGHGLLLYVARSVLSARQDLAERVDYVVFLRLSKAKREASRILRFEQTMRGRARSLGAVWPGVSVLLKLRSSPSTRVSGSDCVSCPQGFLNPRTDYIFS
jgi:hypothetical protein